jgi:hypothetical protein
MVVLKRHHVPHAEQLIQRYLENNRIPVVVTSRDALSRDMATAPTSPVQVLTSDQRRRYAVSRVAFVGTTALVYVEFDCGKKWGRGTYLLLELTDGRWTIRYKAPAWVS